MAWKHLAVEDRITLCRSRLRNRPANLHRLWQYNTSFLERMRVCTARQCRYCYSSHLQLMSTRAAGFHWSLNNTLASSVIPTDTMLCTLYTLHLLGNTERTSCIDLSVHCSHFTELSQDLLSATQNTCLLWPNGRMDQDTTWHTGRPRPRWHCVK